MENFFTEFLGPDSMYILLVAAVCFLIGFITAWLMWRGRAKRFQKEADKWKKQYDELHAEHEKLKAELELKDADVVKAQREMREAQATVSAMKADKIKWQSDLDAALEGGVVARENASAYLLNIEALNGRIAELESKNVELDGKLLASAYDANSSEAAALERVKELEAKVSELEAEKERLVNADAGELTALKTSHDEATARINELEKFAEELQLKNSDLQSKLDEQGTLVVARSVDAPAVQTEEIYAPAPETTHIDKGEALPLDAVTARGRIKEAMGTAIPAAAKTDRNDLTKINGIGSFLEQQLNEVGIYTYEQISVLDEGMIDELTAAIGFFPGRIVKDDWVGQAKILMNSAVPAVDLLNLQIVEGIGPKIEALLKENGVPDLKSLSGAAEDRLKEILHEAGSRYRMHDPATWPQQATLAVNGEMEALEVLQDRLKGGRDVG